MAASVRITGFGNRRDLLDDGISRYVKLMSPWADLIFDFHKPLSAASASVEDQLAREEKILLASIPERSHTATLWEGGKLMDSRAFASWIGERMRDGRMPVFVVGSAQGISSSFRNKSDSVISLSPMTMPYKICLQVLTEQIYRAFTILNGHPYHK